MAGPMVDAKFRGLGGIALSGAIRACLGLICHAKEMVTAGIIARRMQFFQKIAWQIGQAFVLAHSRRAER